MHVILLLLAVCLPHGSVSLKLVNKQLTRLQIRRDTLYHDHFGKHLLPSWFASKTFRINGVRHTLMTILLSPCLGKFAAFQIRVVLSKNQTAIMIPKKCCQQIFPLIPFLIPLLRTLGMQSVPPNLLFVYMGQEK